MAGADRRHPARHARVLRVERSCARKTPEPDLWLVFALLKRDATDLVVQKATELGPPPCCR